MERGGRRGEGGGGGWRERREGGELSPGQVVLSPILVSDVVPVTLRETLVFILQGAGCRARSPSVQAVSAPPQEVDLHLVVSNDGRHEAAPSAAGAAIVTPRHGAAEQRLFGRRGAVFAVVIGREGAQGCSW